MRVRTCQTEYSSLSWFLNKKNPSMKSLDIARCQCCEGAMELLGGHVRALAGTAHAKALPARPKPLCLVADGSERVRMSDGPVETQIPGLEVRKVVDGALSKRLSQVLLRVDALQE
jgi:hypothetical protein